MRIHDVNELKALGRKLGRAGMAEQVILAVKEFDGESYKDAMRLAGKLKAIAVAAQCDDYWSEKVNVGMSQGLYDMRRAARETE